MTLPATTAVATRTCQDCQASFQGTIHARFGPCCRWTHRGRATLLYQWTDDKDTLLRTRYDSRIRNRTRDIATALGWPTWVIKKRAQTLGLAQPWPATRRTWTRDEEQFLDTHAGTRHVHWLATHLKRPIVSVVLKMKRLHLRRRVTEGYTLRDLEACFGVDHHVIERWVREQKLTIHRRSPEAAHRSPWLVRDRDLLAFIRTYPTTINLAKVDALWFLDLILGTTLLDHAA